ncbi:hypothetical protein F4806DRAFT_495740 [Annulohypoxylon nitens]|nr:hypothetical protein F4806DRAFT_495740 [Annulohypoxylon nitens]
MASLAGLFPPGTDLCEITAGSPPPGETVNLNDPGLRPLSIVISIIMTTIAVIIALGRLYANFRKLTLSDLFVLLTILTNVAQAVVIIISIWVGITITFILYALNIVLCSYYATPHVGETWDELIVQVMDTKVFMLYFGVVSSSIGTLLDIYIFILPLPIIYRLKLSKKRKIQFMALFFIGLLGVVSSVICLVYRVKSIEGDKPDTMYNSGVLMICNIVEMDVALIVCSTVAFSGFMRVHVLESRVFKSLRSILKGSRNGSNQSNLEKSVLNPNRPRTGRREPPRKKGRGLRNMASYIEMSDSWLLNSGATTNVEGPSNIHKANHCDNEGLRVLKTVDVEHMPASVDDKREESV